MLFVTVAHAHEGAACPRSAPTGRKDGVECVSFSFFLVAPKCSLASWTKDVHTLELICVGKEY